MEFISSNQLYKQPVGIYTARIRNENVSTGVKFTVIQGLLPISFLFDIANPSLTGHLEYGMT